MKLFNTLTRAVEEITPQNPPNVTIYTCGPTVYDYAHVGHWFNYVRMDTLIRTLKANNLAPQWVMNITDVGHLTSDADEGEDKLEKGARREGKTAWEIAEFYTKDFLEGMRALNMLTPDFIVKATDHIPEQIVLIQTLEAKGYTYIIDDGVYYDTSKFPAYADFARLDLDEQQAGARVNFNPQKRNISDFALWKFTPEGQKRDMEWWGPWEHQGATTNEQHVVGEKSTAYGGEMQGAAEQRTEPYGSHGEGVAQAATPQIAAVHGAWGFPGWHIECSAMSMKYLGETLDIHTGGIDHVPIHHTNEIAQSEAATGKRFANYWMHSNHVTVNGQKISKSLGNGIRLQEITEAGITPEALRLHILESHYRSQAKFSWDSLRAAQNRLRDLHALAALRYQALPVTRDDSTFALEDVPDELARFLSNDLDTPQALAFLSDVSTQLQAVLIEENMRDHFERMLQGIDDLLGLGLMNVPDITDEQKDLIAQREVARQAENWPEADRLRDQLQAGGIIVRDTSTGPLWSRA